MSIIIKEEDTFKYKINLMMKNSTRSFQRCKIEKSDPGHCHDDLQTCSRCNTCPDTCCTCIPENLYFDLFCNLQPIVYSILNITSKELLAFGYIWLTILNLDYLSSHWVSFGYLSLSLLTFPYFSLALTSQEKQPVMCKNGQKYQNILSMIKPISSVARICYPKLCPLRKYF